MSHRMCQICFAVGLLSCLFCAGCGQSVGTAPVSGTVTLNGEPLADAHVSFEPVRDSATADAVGSFGKTNAEGHYSLELVTSGQSGAMPGMHVVRITTAKAEDPSREDSPITPELAPQQYRTGVQFEVPAGGTDTANFDM